MIESITHYLELYVLPLGTLGVFLASVTEEVVAPIPSALVMTAAGFLFVSGPVSASSILVLIFKVVLPAAVGVTLGSLVIFYAAWWGGKTIIEKWGKWVGLNWSDVIKLDEKIKNNRKDEILIISARAIPAVPTTAVSAFCGLVHMSLFKYVKLTFIGSFIRALILAILGWQVGNIYYKYADIVSRFEKMGLIVIVSLLLLYLIVLFLRKYRRNNTTDSIK